MIQYDKWEINDSKLVTWHSGDKSYIIKNHTQQLETNVEWILEK